MSTPFLDLTKRFEKLFDEHTMSVHIKSGQAVRVKKGAPGGWELHSLSVVFSRAEIRQLRELIHESIAAASHDDHEEQPVFIELQRPASEVFQCGPYRIVYTKPPVSAAEEFTIVRPVKKLDLDAYEIDEKILTMISNPHHGVLIAGSPGEGKSTFAQALTGHLVTQNLVIKTIEAPRDLQVDKTITQLSFFHATHPEIRDILLLSRPDITIFDEVRNHDDFHLYKDLRLAGIGMIGVMHATQPIDALQRFLHAVDLGSAAHVISCIVFIRAGTIGQILTLKQTVKVPIGMLAEDLARPVIEVTDAVTGIVTHEVYSYGEQVVVMPTDQLAAEKPDNAILTYAAAGLGEHLQRARKCPVQVIIDSPTQITVSIPKHAKGEIIGRNGETIKKREKKLGCAIHLTTEHLPKELLHIHDPVGSDESPGRSGRGKRKRRR